MASSDFKLINICDSRINDITDQITYAVQTGAASNTYQQFNATTASTSQISFNVSVPSESIVVSRDIQMQTTYTFTLKFGNATTGAQIAATASVWQYGQNLAFQAFPVAQTMTTISSTINNANVSCNVQDILPQLIKMLKPEDLQKYNGTTPTMPDGAYKEYTNGDAGNNHVLASYIKTGYNNRLLPRGAHPINIKAVRHYINAGGTDTSFISTHVNDYWVVVCESTFVEPLFLSPYMFAGDNQYNNQGFVGINTLTLTCNIDSSLKRFLSYSGPRLTGGGVAIPFGVEFGDPVGIAAVAITEPVKSKLLINFLSTQPTQLIKARNIVPYHDFPRWISQYNATIAAGASATITSNNIQLNQLPDSFIIVARQRLSTLTPRESSSFLPIRKISVNLNNSSGLLSSATTEDLFNISVANGSYQNWYEFYGYANSYSAGLTNAAAYALTPTGGSMLILNPARDLSIPAYLSSGSIGQYSFTIDLTVVNNGTADISPEICIIAVNSGIFTTIAGSSSIYTGILTKQMVLDLQDSSNDTISSGQYQRLVGGSLGNIVASAIKSIPMVKNIVDNFRGGARSGGSSCGGASSAGARKLDLLSM
jgi:hypothetical protein